MSNISQMFQKLPKNFPNHIVPNYARFSDIKINPDTCPDKSLPITKLNLLDTTIYASQSPHKDTIAEFWQFVINNKISDIIALTPFNKNSDPYFLTTIGTCNYGNGNNKISVGTLSITHYSELGLVSKLNDTHLVTSGYVIFNLGLTFVNFSYHSVNVIQYFDWQTGGTPNLNIASLLNYSLSKVQESQNLLVHCSAGVSRTGTFLTLLYYSLSNNKGYEAVNNIISELREKRSGSVVLNLTQYKFIICFLECCYPNSFVIE
ncbi:protein tyrosine phosphatase [Hokovirus HKV1]|uniref:Protein tyrosine phosphatase n=1 Tax=Hokovirus HKV1 TaxID=1977638 RepID=A0A1V0SEY5_9VIRU|nr:protein tyrosine phosphatase [Hokovirus HKV1]